MIVKKTGWKIRTGIILIIISIPVFLFLPFIPFLELENKVKMSLATFILVMAELLFWSGGFLVGKELFNKYKTYLNPKNWFRGEGGNIEEN